MIQLLYLDREELKAKTLLQLQIALKREEPCIPARETIHQSLELPRMYKNINKPILNWRHNQQTH